MKIYSNTQIMLKANTTLENQFAIESEHVQIVTNFAVSLFRCLLTIFHDFLGLTFNTNYLMKSQTFLLVGSNRFFCWKGN